jgi:hypothetical protein
MRVGVLTLASVVALCACGDISPASLEFVEVVPAQPRLGEIATVKFLARDSRGLPMAGVPVTFELQSGAEAVTLQPTEASTNKGDGIAQAQLVAGTRVASVVVVATSGDKVATSPPITFAGSAPSARQFTFQCGGAVGGEGAGGVRAIAAYDASRSLIAGVKLECSAHVGDRNGDGIAGARVSFLTEAGTIGPTETTTTEAVGSATVLYKTSYPLPKETDPGRFTWNPLADAVSTGEYLAPLWMHPFEWRQNPILSSIITFDEPRRPDPVRPGRVNNPRDNLVTIIAITVGEEAFDDDNNNGIWDPGEAFVDLTEPFVDDNDNGTWDPGERYVDANGDGVWTGKNGRYDASTLIWVQERILWTGLPHELDYQLPNPVIQRVLPVGSIEIPHFGEVVGQYRVSDPWFNSYAQNGASDGCKGDFPSVLNVFPALYGVTGVRFTYPPVNILQFTIRDAHDPNSDPRPPPNNPPVPWTANLFCEYTSSPVSGFKMRIALETHVGTVY